MRQEGPWGSLSEGRKVLPHFIERPFGLELRAERQLGPETLPSTAPEDGCLREGGLPLPVTGP